MSEQTLEAPPLQIPDAPPARDTRPRRTSAAELARRYPWLLAAAGLLALSTVLVLWAGTRPGYDPYGWLVWGKLTVHWNLDTNGAPSWKPLPFLFTVPYSIVGHYSLWLWMITSVAVSLSGAIFAWRIAFWLTKAPPERRYAAYAAGAFAAATLLGIADYTHFIFSAQSDTMIVALCLAAVDCHLCGRYRWAFWLWVLGALGRPEVWPFLGIYTIWAWLKFPEMRRMIVGGIVLLPLLWFGIPALTAKSAFIAGSNALHSPRELHNNKFFGTIGRFFHLHVLVVQLCALGAAAIAIYRRERFLLILAGGVCLWVLVEAAFALHGWPAVPRYLFEAVGAMCVLAGVFLGRVILDLPGVLARFALPRLRPGFASRVGTWGTVLVLAVVCGSLLPTAAHRLRVERRDLTHERARTTEINRLSGVVSRLGAAHILACGQPNIPIGYQSVFAWYMGIKVGILYVSPGFFKLHPHPLVNIYPLSNGWKVFPSHVDAAHAAACRGLRLTLRT